MFSILGYAKDKAAYGLAAWRRRRALQAPKDVSHERSRYSESKTDSDIGIWPVSR